MVGGTGVWGSLQCRVLGRGAPALASSTSHPAPSTSQPARGRARGGRGRSRALPSRRPERAPGVPLAPSAPRPPRALPPGPAPPRAPPPLPAPAGARAAPRPLAAPEEGGPFLFAPDIPLVRSVLPAAERRGGAVPLAPLSPHPSSPPAPSPPRSAPAGGTGADGASPSVSPGVSSVPQQQQQRLAG